MEVEYGKKIKAARIERGLSLEDVSYDLKINLKTLKRIESSRTEELPKAPFTKGFIKTYCVHLGMNPSLVIEEYEQTLEVPLSHLNKGVLEEEDKAPSFFAFDFIKVQILPISILISTVVGAGLVYSLLTSDTLSLLRGRRATVVEVSRASRVKQGPKNGSVQSDANGNKVNTSGAKGLTSKLPAPKKNIPSKLKRVATVYSGEKVADKNQKNLVAKVDQSVKASNAFNEKKIEEPKAKPKAKPAVIFANTLVVEPLAKTYLYIQTNLDEKPVRATLRPDKRRTFNFDSAQIKFLDAGAVNVILNGEDVGALGVFGEAKKLEFPSMKVL